MGQALYRKYRSKSLIELVGQEHITKTLQQAMDTGRLAHAYLFTGPRGVGKTSTARILAHAINGLSYGEGETHLDIIEIDAASNNSVEDIRDLREKVYIAPSIGKYKVYIIDEVHMLSKAAFNAILKTLEEPPAHVVFILATTEAHKLPATIVSRTQRYVFRPIPVELAVKHLRSIADAEGITVTDEALDLLALHGDGSFRDSISLLDQASNLGKNIDLVDVQSMLGVPSSDAILQLTQCVCATPIQLAEALQVVYGLYGQGFQATAIAHELSTQLRQQIIAGQLAPQTYIVELLDRLLDVPTRRDPERFLEITLLGLGHADNAQPAVSSSHSPAPALVPPTQAEPADKPAAAKHRDTPKAKPEPTMPADKPTTATDPPATADTTSATPNEVAPEPLEPSEPVAFDENLWPQVLNELKKQYNTLYGIVRMADVRFKASDHIELGFAFAFHQKRVNEVKNKQIIGDIVEKLTDHQVQISCVHDADLKSGKTAKVASSPAAVASVTAAPDTSLTAVSNIFGGGELLQS